jgi:hypothetical protein
MIGSLVKYRSTRPCLRASQLGIVVACSAAARCATVRWLEDGMTLVYLVRELEVVQAA